LATAVALAFYRAGYLRNKPAGGTPALPRKETMICVAGVDGYKNGWFVVLCEVGSGSMHFFARKTFAEILSISPLPKVIAVDIPIGVLDVARHGGRDCDVEARIILKQRRSSVFSPPVRAAISPKDYESAKRANRESSPSNIGISKQAYGIAPKILDVDAVMTREQQERVFEVHPELSFFEMGGHPMRNAKKTEAGYRERKSLMPEFREVIQELEVKRLPKLQKDDVLDACAACWTAIRILEKVAVRIPSEPNFDSKGLRMEMWR
jgi:predicted RNase H-like nuclease